MRLIGLMLLLALTAFGDASGQYSGTWTSAVSGEGGKIEVTLAAAVGGSWSARSSFTYRGQDVKTNPVSAKVDGEQVDVFFEYELDGVLLHSRLQGTLAGKTIKGKYVSSAAADSSQQVDAGAWEATQK